MSSLERKHFIASIENASILRKFTILFFVISLLPAGVLYYFYTQLKSQGTIDVSESSFNLVLIFVACGVLLGYATMRSLLLKIIELTSINKKTLDTVLNKDEIKDIQTESNEITILTKSFTAITKKLEENVKSLEDAKRMLHVVMAKVGEGISNLENIDTFLELILETVTDALSGKIGVLILIDRKTNEYWIKLVHGVRNEAWEDVKVKIEKGTTIHTVMSSKRPLIIPKMVYGTLNEEKHSFLFDAPLISAPMIYRDHVTGVIIVSGTKNNINFSEDEMNLLFNLATQTAVALENSRLNKDIEKTYFETISALALAVDARDKYSRGHLDRVASYCVRIARKLGLDEDDIKTLRDAARLHDLGKIGIPDDILSKVDELNEHEWELMQKHTEIGETIIKPIRSLSHLCDLIRHHHEKLDGSGYPDGLKGLQISPLVRILTIADIYDALTTNRPYRERMTKKEACQVLRNMNTKLDPDIIEAFIESLREDDPSFLLPS